MKPSNAYEWHREAIPAIVGRHCARPPRFFGSVVHREDTEASDLSVEDNVLTPRALPGRRKMQVLDAAIAVPESVRTADDEDRS